MFRPWGSRRKEDDDDNAPPCPFHRNRSRDVLDRRPFRQSTTESQRQERIYGDKRSKRIKRKNTHGRDKEEDDEHYIEPWNGEVNM